MALTRDQLIRRAAQELRPFSPLAQDRVIA